MGSYMFFVFADTVVCNQALALSRDTKLKTMLLGRLPVRSWLQTATR